MAIAQEDRFPITDILRQTPDIPDGAQWAIFLRNHDELTLEMVTDRERDYLWSFFAADRRARINLGIRDGVRTPMQWSPDRNGGFSKADPARLFLPPIQDSIYGYDAVNVEAQLRSPASLLNWVRRLIAVRRTHPAFGRGTLRFLYP